MDTAKQRLENKVSVVIGGSTGFGKATVELFAEHGAKVIVVGRRADLAQQVGQEFGGKGFGCDVVEDDQVKNLVD
ncbi:MAG: SDR family NAD(P)-dependent oxidoreductase, partial [Acidimicrobiales bacterium]|nr:SDR family NAD(P)-dependent oxidoreductase [Acidimicrobiales bacterium]